MQRKYVSTLLISILLLALLTTVVSADEQQITTTTVSNDTSNFTVTVALGDENTSINASLISETGSNIPKITYVVSRPYEVTYLEKVASYPEISSQMNISVYLGVSYEDLSFDLSDNDMIVMSNLDSYVVDKITSTVNDAKKDGAYIISVGDTLNAYGLHNVNTSAPGYSDIELYMQYASETNFYHLDTFLGATFFGLNYSIEDPLERPIYGIYHPAAPEIYENLTDYLGWYDGNGVYNSENPNIAVIFDSYKYVERDMLLLDTLVGAIERNGCNVIVTTYSYKDNKSMSYLMMDNKSIADVAILVSRGSRLHYTGNEQGIIDLETLNITVMNGIRLFSGVTVEEWENSTHGVPPDQQYQVAYAELDGLIEPIVISGKATDEANDIEYNQPIDYQIDWLVKRAISWTELHEKENSQKKIVIPYYNPEGGKADVGADIDYYLDAQSSLANLLQAMKDRGYSTGEAELPNSTELAAMMVEKGHNIGTWAPGELDKCVENGSAILIPESQYMSWFEELSKEKRDKMVSMWGEAPGDIMVYENSSGKYLVIPVLQFGNILLAPDPQNGWSSSEETMYNDGSYPPTHQCLAFYKYMSREYNADAMFTIFSSIEMMPGKECGLSAKDWGALLMEDMPQVHVLPMDAEGVFDKRRANISTSLILPPVFS